MRTLRTIYLILMFAGLLAGSVNAQTLISNGTNTVTTIPSPGTTGVTVTAVIPSPDVSVKVGDSTTSAFHIFNPTSATDLLRVQANGHVGIGTGAPVSPDTSEMLQVNGAVKVLGTTTNVTANSASFDWMSGSTKGARIVAWGPDSSTPATFSLLLKAPNGPDQSKIRLFVDSVGRVGIGLLPNNVGLPEPSEMLQVNGAVKVVGATTTITPSSASLDWIGFGTNGARIVSWGPNTTTPSTFSLVLLNSDSTNAQSTRLFVDPQGHIGIGGATAPQSLLDIGSASLIQFQDMSTQGVSNGIKLNLALNSEIDVAGLQIGSMAMPKIQTTSNTLYLQNSAGDVNIGSGTHGDLIVARNITANGTIYANYQDVAEWVPAFEAMAAGTVVVISDAVSNTVTASKHAYDTGVAGVVSPNPGLLLGVAGASKEKIATTGRVRVRVDATKSPIRKGDLLVTSDRPGMAMKSEPLDVGGVKLHRPGTLIGKALEPLASGEGEILVLLSLQ